MSFWIQRAIKLLTLFLILDLTLNAKNVFRMRKMKQCLLSLECLYHCTFTINFEWRHFTLSYSLSDFPQAFCLEVR